MKKAAKRASQEPKISTSNRTFTIEVDDASFAAPVVGTHRIQRIPKTSSSRHTSTATIIILDDESSEAELNESDLSEVFTRGSGPGGQHRNTSDTCVVLTHLPTGETVRIDERSQMQSRQKARKELARRLSERKRLETLEAQNASRVAQATSDRAAKQFTHNEQRGTVVDHQTGTKWSIRKWSAGRW